ncbi:MAG TPA: M3 family metallopeptidase [Burkholderiaceae bacterium]|nr:M3 family metallopeptidase [Burkholderiaceae bacterium]
MTDTAAPASADNPLLDFSGLPRFADFRPEHVAPAIDALLAQARDAVARAAHADTPATWEAFVRPLEDATERLGRAWGVVGHLNGVADTPELRAAYNETLPRITEFWTALGQNEALFAKYRALRESREFASLSPARRRIVEHALRDFRLGGAELVSPARERYAEIQDRQAAIGQKFGENVLDATRAFTLDVTDEARLAGLPEDAKAAARQEAERAGVAGWRFTLQFPSYFPVMQSAHDRSLRETLYRAYVTRASELGPDPKLDNGPIIDETLALRAEEARLLGYPSFADVSLVAKMAESPKQVIDFLRDLAARARPSAERDVAELAAFAKDRLGLEPLMAWDMAYASERLKEERYAFSDNEVKRYFQLPRVLDGLFGLIGRLFDVSIAPDVAQTWHPDVRFFRIERAGAPIGHFFLDMYARPSKRPGAWMDDARGRKALEQGVQTPVAYLTCNVQSPVGDRPALLSHDDVTTLFHEFGHGLHHMLTRVDELGVSGISGVEWDAVELPSQFMENFCWEWDIVRSMTAHVDTGEPLPRELFDRMLAAKNFQSGMQTLRQVEFALFDMRLHAEYAAGTTNVQALLDEVRREVAVLRPPEFNRFQNSFSHIFAGGYAAGYYSYKWAEVLSADCYAAFEEEGVFNATTGRRFLDEILSVGGSRPAIDSFRAFRGREPRIDALLRHNGMVQETTHADA